jgi:hypothetical protein
MARNNLVQHYALNELKLSVSWPLDGWTAVLAGIDVPTQDPRRRFPVLLIGLYNDGFTTA